MEEARAVAWVCSPHALTLLGPRISRGLATPPLAKLAWKILQMPIHCWGRGVVLRGTGVGLWLWYCTWWVWLLEVHSETASKYKHGGCGQKECRTLYHMKSNPRTGTVLNPSIVVEFNGNYRPLAACSPSA